MPVRIQIEKVTNGWLVRAGCMLLVFHDDQQHLLGEEFARWLINSDVVEGEYVKRYGPQPPQPPSGEMFETTAPDPALPDRPLMNAARGPGVTSRLGGGGIRGIRRE